MCRTAHITDIYEVLTLLYSPLDPVGVWPMAMISMTEELRRRAVQIRSDAEQIDEPNVRAKMLEIAAEFELLAKRADHLMEAQGAMAAQYAGRSRAS